MKSAAILAASAAVVLGGAHAAAPKRKRVESRRRHHTVRTGEARIASEEAYDPYLGLSPQEKSEASHAAPRRGLQITWTQMSMGTNVPLTTLTTPSPVPVEAVEALTVSTRVPTYAPTEEATTYTPTEETGMPTYSPTGGPPGTAGAKAADNAAVAGGAGLATLLVVGAAGVWVGMH